MSYSIIRVQKMNGQAIKGIQIHNQREKESETNPDIRKEDMHMNYDLIHGNKQVDYKKEIQKVISENVKSDKKVRKDAVLVSEFLITSDTSFFSNLSPTEQKRYFETTKDFLAKRYGEQNLIYATVHNDERTPHMHVGVVPVTEDGRLSAKDVVGNRMQLVKLQDDFNAHVKAHGYDLARGISSKRKHVEMAKFKAMTAQEAEQEATKNYEQTLSQIKTIEKKTKALEDVQATQKFGQVLMKKDDYETLVNHALTGAVAEMNVTDLQQKLNHSEQQLLQLKDEVQDGQNKVRKLYKGVEERSEEIKTENEQIKENLNALAEQKAGPLAEERVEKILKENVVVQKYQGVVKEYNDIVGKYNQLSVEHTDLEKKSAKEIGVLEMEVKLQKKDYSILKHELKTRTSGWKEENDALSVENNLLREQIKEISNEFKAFKERVVDVLNKQFRKIKTLLNINRIEPNHIKFLDEKHEKIIEDSMKELDKPMKLEKESTIER